jgi:hypothetical protein
MGEMFDGTPIYREAGPPTTHQKLLYLHKHLTVLKEWECGFVCNVINFCQPSEKQRAVVDKLFARVQAQCGGE